MLRVLIHFAELWIRGSNLSCGALLRLEGPLFVLRGLDQFFGSLKPDTWESHMGPAWARHMVPPCMRWGGGGYRYVGPGDLPVGGMARMSLSIWPPLGEQICVCIPISKQLTIPISHTYTSIPNSIPARPLLAEIVRPWTSQEMTETVVAHRWLLGWESGAAAPRRDDWGRTRSRGPAGTGPPLPPPPGVATHDGCLDRVLRMLLTTHSIVLRAKYVARIWLGGGA